MRCETEAETEKLSQPPAGACANAGKMRVRVPDSRIQFAKLMADPRCLIHALLVWMVAPKTKCKNDALRQLLLIYQPAHLVIEFFFLRQKMNAVEKFAWEVPHNLIACVMY